MLRFGNSRVRESDAKLAAIDRAFAVIEFDLDGTILRANDNFLSTMGYALGEIEGRHHSIFIEQGERNRDAYRQFWESLRSGDMQRAQFRRFGKAGREVWIEASYNPLRDAHGRPFRVIKYATDITAHRTLLAELSGQADAIRKSLAVIEFSLDGQILSANDNFLKTLGYSLAEIQGKHHRIFVDTNYAASKEYQSFWETLRSGHFHAGKFQRVGKSGASIWIEATYNPIFDANGRPAKVIKFATDITQQVRVMLELRQIIDRNFSDIDNSIAQLRESAAVTLQTTSHTASNVSAVASATNALTASISEIADKMAQSRQASDEAFSSTGIADKATQRLASSAESMNGIVQLIQEIAAQINLLALNATIESARAGAAGRGFAVVASEVKNLAGQAAEATSRIAKEIEGVQSVSGDVVAALGSIKDAIGSLRGFVSSTAAAVDEQLVMTQNAFSNAGSASTSVSSIDGNMHDVTKAIQRTAKAIERTRDAARVLAH